MNTYKIGNKVTGIIRTFNSGNIGNTTMQYDNQPYTIIKSAEARLTFADNTTITKSKFNQLAFNASKLSQITISDVTLNDKILNLIFSKTEAKMASRVENCVSDDDNLIYLNSPAEKIYQVFIYNNQGELEAAYGEYAAATPLSVKEAGQDYLICYQYESDNSYALEQPDNHYFTLDLLVQGNKEDNTSTMNVHIEKCGLRVDKTMYFNQQSNAVDLIFTVIDTGEDYITLQ